METIKKRWWAFGIMFAVLAGNLAFGNYLSAVYILVITGYMFLLMDQGDLNGKLARELSELAEKNQAQAGRKLDDAKTIFDLGARDRAREKVFEQGTTALIGHPEVIDRILRFVAPHQRGSFIRISEAGDLEKLQGHRLVGVILLDGHDTIDQTWPGLSKYVYSRVG